MFSSFIDFGISCNEITWCETATSTRRRSSHLFVGLLQNSLNLASDVPGEQDMQRREEAHTKTREKKKKQIEWMKRRKKKKLARQLRTFNSLPLMLTTRQWAYYCSFNPSFCPLLFSCQILCFFISFVLVYSLSLSLSISSTCFISLSNTYGTHICYAHMTFYQSITLVHTHTHSLTLLDIQAHVIKQIYPLFVIRGYFERSSRCFFAHADIYDFTGTMTTH